MFAGEALGNGALHPLPAQDEGSEWPPDEPDLTSAWISLTQNPCFRISPLDRWGRFRLGVQLHFAQRDASGHSQTQTGAICLGELGAGAELLTLYWTWEPRGQTG